MKHKIIPVLIIIFAVLTGTFSAVFANSAEPPSFTVYSDNCPEDMEIYVRYEDGTEANALGTYGKERRAWESVFWMETYIAYKPVRDLHIVSSEKNFYIDMPEGYSSLARLDFEKETFTDGMPPWRPVLLIFLRVILTLLTECAVYFFIVRYRQRRSYIAIILINLITQGIVNIMINGGSVIYHGGYFLSYIILEAFVFLTEMCLMPIAVREGDRNRIPRAVGGAFFANLVSLIVGGVILTYLPY